MVEHVDIPDTNGRRHKGLYVKIKEALTSAGYDKAVKVDLREYPGLSSPHSVSSNFTSAFGDDFIRSRRDGPDHRILWRVRRSTNKGIE